MRNPAGAKFVAREREKLLDKKEIPWYVRRLEKLAISLDSKGNRIAIRNGVEKWQPGQDW